MVAEHVAVEPERRTGHRGVHHAAPGAVGLEGLAVAPVADLIPLPAPDEVVVARIEREEHPEVAVRIGVEDDEVAVILGTDVNLGPVARQEAAIAADPELNGGIVVLPGRGPGHKEWKEQGAEHGTSRHN